MDKLTKETFLCFIRNERWGTCASCPRDSDNHVYPEFCSFTDRYDHHIELERLVEVYNREKSSSGEHHGG